MDLRDAIAAHGVSAIVELVPWIQEPALASFAIRAIGRAPQADRETAVAALRAAMRDAGSPIVRLDIVEELARLGAKSPGDGVSRNRRQGADPAVSHLRLDELRRGETFKRRDLHESGLGGNRRKGISYPAEGDHVLLFSDPSKVEDWGYQDSHDGEHAYWYYGEWDGPGDMKMTKGNRMITRRSAQLHLFLAHTKGHLYAGRYQCDDREWRRALNRGFPAMAIVFHLTRV
jgi:hypothetical protein